MGKEEVSQVAESRLIVKAWPSNAATFLVVAGLGTTVLLAIFDMAGGLPAWSQLVIWGAYVALVCWRVWRLGAELTTSGVTIRGLFVDHRIPWNRVTEIAAAESGNTVGVTLVPVVRTEEDGYLVNWLSGYSWKGGNRRVRRQVGQMSRFWGQTESSSSVDN